MGNGPSVPEGGTQALSESFTQKKRKHGEDASGELTPKKSKQNRRRSRAREGRRSLVGLVAEATPVQDFHSQVDSALDPPQQFLQLIDHCVKDAVRRVADKEAKNFKGFSQRAQEVVGEFQTAIEADGEHRVVSSRPILRPNPLNKEMKTSLAQYKSTRERLQREATAWKDAVQSAEDVLAKMRTIVANLANGCSREPSTSPDACKTAPEVGANQAIAITVSSADGDESGPLKPPASELLSDSAVQARSLSHDSKTASTDDSDFHIADELDVVEETVRIARAVSDSTHRFTLQQQEKAARQAFRSQGSDAAVLIRDITTERT